MVTDNQGMAAFSQEAAQAALQQLTSGQGLTLADSDGQHVFVVTDPAQLEALQVRWVCRVGTGQILFGNPVR